LFSLKINPDLLIGVIMKTLNKVSFFLGLVVFLFVTSNAFANTIASGTLCSVENVTLDLVRFTPEINPSSLNLLSGSYDSSACVGLFLKEYASFNNGNDESSPDPNIGEAGDGLLNGENYPYLAPNPDGSGDLLEYFTGEEFVDSSKFQDWDGDGNFTDPGWIHLANLQAGGLTTYSSAGPSPLADITLDIGDLLDINIDYKDGDDYSTGRWTLTTKLNVIEDAQELLGSNTFDHLAISFKSSTAFAVYDFDFVDIFAQEEDQALNFFTPYQLSGTFILADFDYKDVSHVNFWARDPIDSRNVVPEPSTLILLGVGLAGLGLYSRRRR
jgi:hypothetical protein